MEQQLLLQFAGLFAWGALALKILGSLVVAGAIVVALTPSKSDDQKLEKLLAYPFIGGLLKALMAFSPIQKADPKVEAQGKAKEEG